MYVVVLHVYMAVCKTLGRWVLVVEVLITRALLFGVYNRASDFRKLPYVNKCVCVSVYLKMGAHTIIALG